MQIGRLKTGTPPRLDGDTINYDDLEMQPADDDHYYFSFLTNKIDNKQIKCGMTYTNNEVHKIINDNISKKAPCIQVTLKELAHDIVLQLKTK